MTRRLKPCRTCGAVSGDGCGKLACPRCGTTVDLAVHASGAWHAPCGRVPMKPVPKPQDKSVKTERFS